MNDGLCGVFFPTGVYTQHRCDKCCQLALSMGPVSPSSLWYPGELHEHLMATKVISLLLQNVGIEKYTYSCAKEHKGVIVAFCTKEKKHLCKKGYVDLKH